MSSDLKGVHHDHLVGRCPSALTSATTIQTVHVRIRRSKERQAQYFDECRASTRRSLGQIMSRCGLKIRNIALPHNGGRIIRPPRFESTISGRLVVFT